MKVTIRDVAEKAGVSAASVSLVLNDRPSRITPATRERILEVAKALGYQSIREKKGESVGMDRIIGVIQPDVNNVVANECLLGIENYASVYGYKVLLSNVWNRTDKSLEAIKLLVNSKVQGLIVIPPLDMNLYENNQLLGDSLRQAGIPFLLLDRAIDRVFCDFITSDNKQGAYLATEYLIVNGHQQIGLISGMREVYNSRKRVEGYKEALAFYGLSLHEDMIYYGDYQIQSGYLGAADLWGKGIKAIFAGNDEMAMGVYRFAADHGLKVGTDISVVGFDDVPFCELLHPPLSSIRQSGDLMGKKACEMIIKRIEATEREEMRNTYFAPQLVERSSVSNIAE